MKGPMPLTPLPIDAVLPRLLAALREGPSAILTAEPGAGKTTRVPRALLDAGLLGDGECWVLEPRRLAARLAAGRVAEELEEPLGGRVGYAVRFEQKVSKATRIRFVTEGLLLRRLHGDPTLKGIAAVILDEFHERHLHTDSALALLKRLQAADRPDLRLVVMSATLDATPLAAFLGAPILSSEGRAFPVEVRHAARPDDRPVALRVKEALEALTTQGHTLVFLPGAAEIRACLRECEGLGRARGWKLLPFHGDLSWDAQQEAVRPSDQPKVLFSTNVAESSVTIPGITAVVDSGLGREAVFDPWSGLTQLRTARISQARCVQRTGRAGRTGPGLCVRLYTEAEFAMREGFDAPELRRADLSELALNLHGLGLPDPLALPWLEAPPEAALRGAERLLVRLGALGTDGALTSMGQRMSELPLHPRLARMLLAAEQEGIGALGALAAALLESGNLRIRRDLARSSATGPAADADLLLRLDDFRTAEAERFAPGALRAAGLDAGAVHRAKEAAHAHRRLVSAGTEPPDAEARFLQCLLRGWPDRVARRGEGRSLQLSEGGGAVLDEASAVRSPFLLALEAEGSGNRLRVTDAARLEPEWVMDAFPDELTESDELRWNASAGRVERKLLLRYREVVLDETRKEPDPENPAVQALMLEAALARGEDEAQAALLDRLAFLSTQRAELNLGARADLRRSLLAKACEGHTKLGPALDQDLAWLVGPAFGDETARLLEAWAPAFAQLPKRRVKVNYSGERPWIESRLQDFLGMKEGPSIAGGRLPLVIHLLAPNYRAVQVTTDLAGFWHKAYQEIRPQLSRRYPRHFWPEKPELETEPPEPKGR
jgi:ATP-dependent helicase HrpB